MCGIAGYIGPERISDKRIADTLARMRHRGPDLQRSEYFLSGDTHVHLLHSRLSIIDLDERSGQPFHLGSKCLIYNGEIYNYRELRQELERLGRRFVTRSDTEVLLHLLDVHGVEALDRCEGMWAFALYDRADGSLMLARDRFGEKPLYLFHDGRGGTFFASEIKAIAGLRGGFPTVDRQHLSRYLVNGYKALYKKPATFFEGIEELPPATVCLRSRDGAARRQKYWKPAYRPDRDMTFDEAASGAREHLMRSVELRLRADVPLAFCMSGGVDSNALISLAKREFGHDVHGFTVLNSDSRYDEREILDIAVAELQIRHTNVPLTTDGFMENLRSLVRHHDAPVSTVSYYVHWLLMKAVAKAGYRVSISGTGADEIFTGYYDHHLAYLAEIRDDTAQHAKSLAAWQEHVRPITRNPFLSDPNYFVNDPDARHHIFLGAEGFAEYLHEPWREPFEETDFGAPLLRNRMLNEMFHESVPVILHEDDMNAMSVSIENRSPFLDRHLFEFCNTIPTPHLIRDGYAKAVLREAVRDVAPAAVVDCRRKVGFNAPILELLDVGDPRTRAEILRDGPLFDVVRRDRLIELLERDELSNSESKFLFYVVNAKMFLETFSR